MTTLREQQLRLIALPKNDIDPANYICLPEDRETFVRWLEKLSSQTPDQRPVN